MELQTPALRRPNHVRRPIERYSPPNFCSAFVLSTINDEPRPIKEPVSSEVYKILKNSMV